MPANDAFADRININAESLVLVADGRVATRESGESVHGDVGASGSLWWDWTPGYYGAASLLVASGSANTGVIVVVYTTPDGEMPALNNLTPVATFRADESSAFEVAADKHYLIAVDSESTLVEDVVVAINQRPVINCPAELRAEVGKPVDFELTAHHEPTSLNVVDYLPAGLSYNSATRRITGSFQQIEDRLVEVEATNRFGTNYAYIKMKAYKVGTERPLITNHGVVSLRVGNSVDYQLSAANAVTTWSADGLPSGLSLDSATGRITGTPTYAQTNFVNVTAANSWGSHHEQIVFEVLQSMGAVLHAPSVVLAKVGDSVSFPVRSSEEVDPVGMPSGFTYDSEAGVIRGTAQFEDDRRIQYWRDGAFVAETLLRIDHQTVPSLRPAAFFDAHLLGVDGRPVTIPITLSSPGATVSINNPDFSYDSAAGVIRGVTFGVGRTTLIVTVSNANGSTWSEVSILCSPSNGAPPSVFESPIGAYVYGDDVFSFQLLAAGATEFLISPDLPEGLSLDASTGRITGYTTRNYGEEHYYVEARDEFGSMVASDYLALRYDDRPGGPLLNIPASTYWPAGARLSRRLRDYSDGYFSASLAIGLSLNGASGLLKGRHERTYEFSEDVTYFSNGAASVSNRLTFIGRVQGSLSAPAWVKSEPVDRSANVGGSARFSVKLGETVPGQSHLWRRNGQPVVDSAGLWDWTVSPIAATMDGDVYQVVLTSPAGVTTSDAARLTVDNAMSLEAWLDAYSVPSDKRGPLHDPSGQGVPNLLAYASGIDPANGSDHMPIPTFDSANGILSLTYRRNKLASEVYLRVETSSDLGNWQTEGITDTLMSDDGAIQIWRASVSYDSGPRFLRLFSELKP